MAKRFDILGIGCVAVDDLLYVDAYPQADTKLRINRAERKFGGLTGTALVTAAELGGRCAFAGLLGEDELSLTVEHNFLQHGIDVSEAVRRKEARPVHSVIVVGETMGTRNIFFDASAPTGADPSGPSEDLIRTSRILFVDYLGIEGGIRAAWIARTAGVPIVADLEDDRDPGFCRLLDLVDHLIISHEFAAKLTGIEDPAASLRAVGNRPAVIVTCGKDGSYYLVDGEVRHQPAFKVQTVDSTGCGDVFHGAYALALAREQPIEERMRFASAAAAAKAALGDIPSIDDVDRLLMDNQP